MEDHQIRPNMMCGLVIARQLQYMRVSDVFNKCRISAQEIIQILKDEAEEPRISGPPNPEEENRIKQNISSLLNIYSESEEKYKKLQNGDAKKYPLIVLEGLDGCGKTTVGKRLAKAINGINLRTPPECVKHLRKEFDDDKALRIPYYFLGNYIAAMEMFSALREHPVVLDRYWHSTVAFGLAQMCADHPDFCREIPSKPDDVYTWPEDLLKPDMVILLNVSENVRKERISRRTEHTAQENLLINDEDFRKNVLSAYENMENPKVEKIDGDADFEGVLLQIDNKIKHLLK